MVRVAGELRERLSGVVFAALLVLPAMPEQAHAQPPRFCVVPVQGASTQELGWRAVNNFAFFVQIPADPAPIYFGPHLRDPRTINARRELVSSTARFPTNIYDQRDWAVDPQTSRILAIPWNGEGLFAKAPGEPVFQRAPGLWSKRTSSIQVLESANLTVAIDDGVPYVVTEQGRYPWLTRAELDRHGIDRVLDIHDVPRLGGYLIWTTPKGFFAIIDGRWHHIGFGPRSPGRNVARLLVRILDLERERLLSDVHSVFDIASAGAVVVKGARSVFSIRKEPDGEGLTVRRLPHQQSVYRYTNAEEIGQLLYYGVSRISDRQAKLHRLGEDGLEFIAGADGVRLQDPTYRAFWHQAARGYVLTGVDRLYFYDGQRLAPIPGGEYRDIGAHIVWSQSQEIGRMLGSNSKQLFEITDEPRVQAVDVAMPPTAPFLLADWAGLGIAMTVSDTGLFALDKDLNAMPVAGGEDLRPLRVPYSPGAGTLATGELALITRQGLFLAIDKETSGESACGQAGNRRSNTN